MKAELKRLHSPDVKNLKSFRPENEDNFGILLQIMVGIKGKEGEESFDTLLCTPKWLAKQCDKSIIINGLHHLFVFKYDFNEVFNYLSNIIDTVEVSKWEDIAEKLRFLGKWEFENYNENS